MQAYQQMVLEPDHRKYTTINTHLGIFQYTQLPFGIASALALFQQQMEKGSQTPLAIWMTY